MKFNWGTGIVIVIALFMAFILQYVIRVQFNADYDNELVTEDYYQKEIKVDSDYAMESQANALETPLAISNNFKGIQIEFPAEFDYKNIQGTIFLYRPSNQKLDFDIPVELSSSILLIPKEDLVDGRWNITVDWNYQGKSFRNTQQLNLK